jgi:hypothetical protein
MTEGRALRFVLGGAAVAVLSGGAAWAAARPASYGGFLWGALGWGLMAAIGLSSGAWLAAKYGSTGSGFLAAIVAGILGRIAATVGGAATAAAAGRGPLWAFLVGLGSGFAPLMVYEAVFFYRAGRRLQGLAAQGGSRA